MDNNGDLIYKWEEDIGDGQLTQFFVIKMEWFDNNLADVIEKNI